MKLLDTDIMVDLQRGRRPALEWLASLDEAPGLPGFVVMELMEGCRNKQEMSRLSKRLGPFCIYWPTAADCNRALTTFARARLSHGTGILDAVIGECAVGLGAALCTFNERHFSAVPKLKTEQPYERQG